MSENKLLDLAIEKFKEISDAEKKLFEAVANGHFADYSAESQGDNDPADAEDWGEERVLNADRISWLCTDGQAWVWSPTAGFRCWGHASTAKLTCNSLRLRPN